MSGTYSVKDGTKVIASSAFSDCDSLTSITISDSVTNIGDNAFRFCDSLTSVTIGNSVTSIDSSTFRCCTSLTSVTIPDSVTSIGNYAFHKCTSLTSITIPDSVTNIGECAFEYCDSLTSVTIPDSVTSIGVNAFSVCTSLTIVTIGNNVTSINGTFYGCTSLTSIKIGDSVTSISRFAFYNTGIYNNESNWENDVLYIGNYLIGAKNTLFGTYSVKDGTKVIADNAFSGCQNLTSITISNSVTSIGDSAFRDCANLTSITIPDSVTSIGDFAFVHCANLTSITIGNSVTSIGDYAFSSCTSLTSITIPDSVTIIGDYGFNGCDSLTNVYYTGTETQWNETTIGSHNEPLFNVTIHFNYVPEKPEKEYIAKWIVDGHMVKVLSVPEGSEISSPENPVKDGYEFLGWTPEVPETMPPQHMTFTAVWQEAVTLPSDEPVVLEDGLNVFVNNTSLSFPTDEIAVIAVSRVTNNALSIPENISVEISDKSVIQLFKIFDYDELKESSFAFLFNSMSDTFKNSTFVMLKTVGEGISGVKITDNDSKESVSMPIKVYDDKYDYLRAEKVPINEYAPEMFGATVEKDYYNYYVNGIFVSDFEYTKVTGGYTFKMNAYNERYSLGAVEVFKEDGTLIKVEIIDKYETTGTSLYKTFEAGWFVIKDIFIAGDALSFRSRQTSKLTEIEVFVPEGGFVRVVNDSTASTPCFLINMFDAVLSAGDVVKSMASTVDGIVTHLSKSQVKEITKEAVGKFIANSYYLNIADKYKEKIVNGFVEDVTESALVSTVSWIAQEAEGLLLEVDLTLKDLCMGALESTVDVAEDIFVVLTGPVGICLSGAFTGMKCVNFNDQLLDWKETFNGQGYRGIFTPNEYSAGIISSADGISVEINNNVSDGTILQTIRILKGANVENNIGKLVEINNYKLYDISLLNNGVETQPDGTVTVNVPVPVGFENDITVLRENDDGTWEIIASEVIDGKIVFNVDHFCLFAFVENKIIVNFDIRNPSTTTISYGDSIILHVDIDGELPSGYYVEWTASNSNFSYSANGTTCTISPEKSGDTTFTATIYDADGNAVSTDEQTMTSKAGFFDKIIAFFKKLFGLTKTIPQAFKGIL